MKPADRDHNLLLTRLFSQVDNASLTVFRIGWGWIITVWAWDYLTSGQLTALYVEPTFHFTYQHFGWVRPLPGPGMYLHFMGLILAGLAITVGFHYRIASVVFAIGFTYFFLLEQTNYQNHYYLVTLLSWVNIFLPLHRNLSWDARHSSALHSQTAPTWALWLVRFHVGVPYFFGGLAKLIPDWMLGEPMRTMLLTKTNTPLIGSFFSNEFAGLIFSWGGIILDLTIVPLLLYRKTRLFAFLIGLIFHLTNSVLFNIHIFPWFMIIATTIFFEPDWPRRVLGLERLKALAAEPISWNSLSTWRKLCLIVVCFYIGYHMIWPLRYKIYAGDASWTERGHFFSWRMMLRGKTGGVRFFVTDQKLRKTYVPDFREMLSEEQIGKFPRNPEWILQFAHHLADQYRQRTGNQAEVRALVLLSLNGRKPQLLVDPNIDLATVPRGQSHRPWVLPNEEPLRREPWIVPVAEWDRYVELPPLQFLREAPLASSDRL